MGLTISYDLTTDLKRPQDVRRLVEAMRQHALDLPFKAVDEIKEFKGSATGWEDKDDLRDGCPPPARCLPES